MNQIIIHQNSPLNYNSDIRVPKNYVKCGNRKFGKLSSLGLELSPGQKTFYQDYKKLFIGYVKKNFGPRTSPVSQFFHPELMVFYSNLICTTIHLY